MRAITLIKSLMDITVENPKAEVVIFDRDTGTVEEIRTVTNTKKGIIELHIGKTLIELLREGIK